ncbi:MAG: helix-turn-helix domain-containing protein [Acholeplasmatales bacterium]|jgi:transcriptional regulator with XRE-family HTH domain|nr:helix-turn-helix domain-containing protein [Acholeplasmatales bacterium]
MIIKKIRQKINIKQSEMAGILNTSKEVICAYESNRASIEYSDVILLCNTLNVSSNIMLDSDYSTFEYFNFPPNLSLGEKLKYLRKLNHYTLRQLEQKTGYSRSSLSGDENNKYRINEIKIIKFCECYKITPDNLLGIDSNSFNQFNNQDKANFKKYRKESNTLCFRKKLNVTQKTISLILNCSRVIANAIEHGNCTLSVDMILKLCKHFKVSASYILDLEDLEVINHNLNYSDSIGAKLLTLRKAKDITSVATDTSIKLSRLKKLESNVIIPNSKDLIILCKYYQVSADELLGIKMEGD